MCWTCVIAIRLGLSVIATLVGQDGGPTPPTQGFLLSGGSFCLIDCPTASVTVALGINDNGQMVGAYIDSFGGMGNCPL